MYRFNKSSWFVVVLACCLLVSAGVGNSSAAILTWDGGGGDGSWTTAANWSSDALPTIADAVWMDESYTSPFAVSISGAASALKVQTARGTTANVTLTIEKAGSLTSAGYVFASETNSVNTANYGTGTIINKGTLTATGSAYGALALRGGSKSKFIEQGGVVNLVNGASYTGDVVYTYEGGTLEVVGGGGSFTAAGSLVASTTTTSSLNLAAQVDSSTGLTTMAFGGAATLIGTLDVGFTSGSTATAGTWDVLTAAGGINATQFALSSEVASGWSYAIVNGGSGGQTLQVAYAVPEPSSIAIIGSALIGLLAYAWRRRR
jgi:hypothetical protein